ncbi:MAG: hypothetical protein HC828_02575 [Blastochloris sp.]|nr:hypothetical protein [Blastochloris sp.]
MTTAARNQSDLSQKVIAGVVGGLVGGVVFGMLMAMMGMLPMIAGMVGSSSAVVGFLVHMVISAVIGASFAVLFGARSTTYAQGAIWGLLYGAIWWVLGPLVLMPLMMGMGLQFGAALSGPMLMSLMGHLIYGVITGLVYAWFVQR